MKTLESAYFHTGNSGVLVSVDTENSIYKLCFEASMFGSATIIQMPLGSDHMVEYLIQALTRVKQHMADHDFTSEYAFEYAREPSVDGYVRVIDGLSVQVIREDEKLSDGTVKHGVARREYHDEDGELVKTEEVDASLYTDYFSGNAGGSILDAAYEPLQINNDYLSYWKDTGPVKGKMNEPYNPLEINEDYFISASDPEDVKLIRTELEAQEAYRKRNNKP